MRPASPDLTVGTYLQAIPESVREAVNSLERDMEQRAVKRKIPGPFWTKVERKCTMKTANPLRARSSDG